MDTDIVRLKNELFDAKQIIEEQRKTIENDKTIIENLHKELEYCKEQLNILKQQKKKMENKLENEIQTIEDIKVIINTKNRYIKSLEEEKKFLTSLNIGLIIIDVIVTIMFIIFLLR